MKKMLKEKVNSILEELSEDIVSVTGCGFLWGEVEVPDCLREKVENEEKIKAD